MIANQMRTNQLGLAATAEYLDFLDADEAKDVGREGFVASIRIYSDILTTLISPPCSQTAGREFGGSE